MDKMRLITSLKLTLVFLAATTIALRLYTLKLFMSSVLQPVELKPIIDYKNNGNIVVRDPAEITPELEQMPESESDRKPKIKPKPKLIIHVGPQKTGSTSIQTLLSRNQDALQNDNYTIIEFSFRQIGVVYRDCFIAKSDCEKWDILMGQFDDAYAKHNGIIWSNEELVNLPMNTFTIPLWRKFLDRWDVQILVFYRPFHQWLYSMYLQQRKSSMFKSGNNKWTQAFYFIDEVKNFPEWLDDHIKPNSVNLRDTMAVKASFEELYGSNRVRVLDMMAPHGVEMEFLDNDIVNSVQARDIFKSNNKPQKQNQASLQVIEWMDTDLIIVEGHRQQIGDLGNIGYQGFRRTRRIKLEAKLKEWNMTTADLPTVCVSKQQEDWLWNRTLYAQNMFSRYPMPEEELRSQFNIDRKKWCGVDARAVLQNSTWKEYLSSCEFRKKGCDVNKRKVSFKRRKHQSSMK